MSELIAELRENCQTLQSELLAVQRSQPDLPSAVGQSSLGVQVNLEPPSRASSLSSLRKSSTSSQASTVVNNESARKARAVYGNRQPAPRRNSRDPAAKPALTASPAKASPSKKPPVAKVNPSPQRNGQSGTNSGAKIAKPVAKPSPTARSKAAKTLSNSRSASPALQRGSRIPQPSPSRIPQPSAARYNTPTHAKKQRKAREETPSPPPPPPPSQLPQPVTPLEALDTPTPPLTPPSVKKSDTVLAKPYFDKNSLIVGDDDEEVLLVEEDGRIRMNKINDEFVNHVGSSGESNPDTEPPSADDEGSRDEGGGTDDGGRGEDLSNMFTPRTRRKAENLKQGLAARRIQRTWKHFYEEVTLENVVLMVNNIVA